MSIRITAAAKPITRQHSGGMRLRLLPITTSSLAPILASAVDHKIKIWCPAALLLALLSGMFSVVASAAPAEKNSVAETEDWVIWATPYIWGLSMDGKAQLGDKRADVDVSFDDILNDLNLGVMGFFDAHKGRVGYFFNPIYSRLKSSERVDDEKLRVTNDTAIIALGSYYRWIDNSFAAQGRPGQRLIVEPYAGVRWTYMKVKINSSSSGQVEGSESWFDPIIGSRAMYKWHPQWDITLAADIGGFGVGSDAAWNAHLLMGYHFNIGSYQAVFRGGYRALHQDYDTGSNDSAFRWDVTQSGPIAGIAIKL